MAEQTTTNRARLEVETYTKLHEVMKQKSGGSADAIYPKLKAFSRFAQDMVTDVRGPAQSHMSGEFVEEWALACEHMQDKLRFYQKLLDQKRGKKTIVRVVKQYVAVDIETQVVDAAPIATAQPPPRLKASPALSEAQVAKHNKACQAIEGIMKDIKTRELQTQEAVKNRGKYQEELRKAQSMTTEDFAKTACKMNQLFKAIQLTQYQTLPYQFPSIKVISNDYPHPIAGIIKGQFFEIFRNRK